MLEVGPIEIPKFHFVVDDEPAIVAAMASAEVALVKARTLAGNGADGPLPRPKDGGQPYNRSGQLIASITAAFGQDGKGIFANVVPEGTRDDTQERKTSRALRAKSFRRELRSSLRHQGVLAKERSAQVKKAGKLFVKNLGRFRGRNMDIASILAYRAKDKRAKERGVYNVFSATEDERERLLDIALRAQFTLSEDDGTRYTGQGERG